MRETEEQNIFRKTCREFVAREITPFVDAWEEQGFVPRSLFEKAGALGLLGLRMRKEAGGLELDFHYTRILVEELVKCKAVGVCVSLMAHCEFASSIIEKHGSPRLQEAYLKEAVQGKQVGALGLTEPHVGSDLARLQTRAVKQNGKYIISGQKTFITNGTLCDFMTTAVRVGEGKRGIALVVIPSTARGFEARRLKKSGAASSDTAEVFLEGVEVPEDHLIGEEGEGFSYILNGFTGERLVLSVIGYTQMENMLEEAVRYGKERSAFGQPLLQFQVWRHRLADVCATLEACRALTEKAIDAYNRGENASEWANMAKLFTAEAMPDVSRHCIQIFGGYSAMLEYTINRLLRDSTHFGVGAGTSEMMREMIAKSKGW